MRLRPERKAEFGDLFFLIPRIVVLFAPKIFVKNFFGCPARSENGTQLLVAGYFL